MNNFTLGPSWLPKIGGLLCAFGGALALIPDGAPGAAYVKPYALAIISFGGSIVGLTSRQNNKSTEEATGKKVDQQPPAIKP